MGVKNSNRYNKAKQQQQKIGKSFSTNKFKMLRGVQKFLMNYFKQGDTLYWYDLRLVE